MLKRAADIYILMTLICGAGLWAILAYGDTLSAPPDLAGKWKLAQTGDMGSAMNVEQSGRFFQISFDNGSILKLKLVEHQGQRLKLAGHGWVMLADRLPGGEDMNLHLAGPRSFDSAAHRILRTYPLEAGTSAGHN